MADKTFIVRIKRQQRPDESVRWEEFELRYRPHMNVIICLRDIAEKPVTRDGREVTPISYEANCLEEVCGACAMLINGHPRQACTALVDDLEKPIRLEPLAKFPLVRDLQVDRSSMFENLKRTKCWIPIDGTYALGEGPRMSPATQEAGYPLSRCITCGNCLEICPRVNEQFPFRRRRHRQPGAPVQYASHGRHARRRAPGDSHGPRRHRGLRQCAELREGLPQGHSAHRIPRRRQWPGDAPCRKILAIRQRLMAAPARLHSRRVSEIL